MNNALLAPKRKARRWIMCLGLLWMTIPGFAQNRIEYFWNTDPGIGKATALVGQDGIIEGEIPTDHLSIGTNLLGIRVLNGAYASSTWLKMIFNSLPLAGNARLEYFWDNDPGCGKATFYPSSFDNDETVVDMSLLTDSLSIGMHMLGLRIGYGEVWSATYKHLVAVSPKNGSIDRLEYFWDSDPGCGKAVPHPVATDGEIAIVNLSLLTDTLSGGMHMLGIRSGNGVNWSQTYRQFIAIAPNGGVVDGIEYFWDDDPGLGKATHYPLTNKGSEVTASFSLLTDGLSRGVHVLGIRSYCGGWSPTLRKTVVVGADDNPVEAVEYFWDDDPGYGKATPLSFEGEQVAVVNEEIPVPETYGNHVLVIRAKSGGYWGTPLVQNICVNAMPDFSLPKDTVCCGEEFLIQNLTIGATEQTTYAWDMDGDGKSDITGGDNFTYTYDEAGEYMISLAVKTVGDCETTCTKSIVVLDTSVPSVVLEALSNKNCAGDTICFVAQSHAAGYQPQYEWLINGKIVKTGLSDTLLVDTLSDGAEVQVRVYSSNPCSQVDVAESAVIPIHIEELPEVSLGAFFPVYTTEKAFVLEGGVPSGGTYYVDGKEAVSFNPQEYGPGSYLITYRYTEPAGCTNEVVQRLEVRTPGEHSLLKGDVNKDETVDILDVLCTIDLIYGRIFPTWNNATADINEDGVIDVSDVVGIVGIILGKENDKTLETVSRSVMKENRLEWDDAFVSAGAEDVDLIFEVDGNEQVSGIQFDVVLPEGVELKSATEGLTVGRCINAEGNIFRLLAYSADLNSLNGKYTVKASLPVNLSEGIYHIQPEQSIMSGSDMHKIIHQINGGKLIVGHPTNIGGISKDGIILSVEQTGLNVRNACDCTLMVTDMSGRFVMATEIGSDNQSIILPNGLMSGTYVAEIHTGEQTVRLKFIWK